MSHDIAQCVVIGAPVKHSLSPLIHRLGYEFLGITAQYTFDAVEVSAEELEGWLMSARTSSIRGISCTMPHKEAVIPLLDELDPVAREIGAVNTIVNEGGRLKGYNTDWEGALRALEHAVQSSADSTGAQESRSLSRQEARDSSPLYGKRVAILGAGGASRALIYAAVQAGAYVKVFNRDLARAQSLAERFGVDHADLTSLAQIQGFDVIVQATSVGMGDLRGESLLEEPWLNESQVILETIYEPHETITVQRARRRGAQVILGLEMLLEQAYLQFQLYTGYQAPALMISREVKRHLEMIRGEGWPEPLICGVVTGGELPIFLEHMRRAQAQHHLVELRADSLKLLIAQDLDKLRVRKALGGIKAELTRPAIFTYRREPVSGTLSLADAVKRQQMILEVALELGFGLIDVDIREWPSLRLDLGDARLILSTHDYHETPTRSQLEATLREMSAHQPFVYKIATYAHDYEDLMRLFSLLASTTHRDADPPQVIIVAMGERFKMSRALSPLLGSYLTYASLEDSHKSAPGQMTREVYREVYQALKVHV